MIVAIVQCVCTECNRYRLAAIYPNFYLHQQPRGNLSNYNYICTIYCSCSALECSRCVWAKRGFKKFVPSASHSAPAPPSILRHV